MSFPASEFYHTPPMISENRLKKLLRSFRHVTIGVLGDFCLDAYWILDEGAGEQSIETGKTTHAVRAQRYSPGGAGNIVENLVALRVKNVKAFGVIGQDLFGEELIRQLHVRRNVGLEFLVQSKHWDTPVYAKPYRKGREQERIDFGRFNKLGNQTEAKLLRTLKRALPTLDALIVNQQLTNGVCTRQVIRELNRLAEREPRTIFLVDSRSKSEAFRNMILKLNVHEAARISGGRGQKRHERDLSSTIEYCMRVFRKVNMPVFLTRGRSGMIVYEGREINVVPGIRQSGPIDPVGAGDTTAAAFASVLAAGGSLVEAAEIANLAAAVTVKKLRQTGTATPVEILKIFAIREPTEGC